MYVITPIDRHLQRESPLSNTLTITLANDWVAHIVDDVGHNAPIFESRASLFNVDMRNRLFSIAAGNHEQILPATHEYPCFEQAMRELISL